MILVLFDSVYVKKKKKNINDKWKLRLVATGSTLRVLVRKMLNKTMNLLKVASTVIPLAFYGNKDHEMLTLNMLMAELRNGISCVL